MKTEMLTVCDHLAGAALNGMGQGILLTLLVSLGLRALGPTNAATRHAVWFGTLLLLVAIIPAQLWRERLVSDRRDQILPSPVQPMEPMSLAGSLPEREDESIQPPTVPEDRFQAAPSSAPVSEKSVDQPLTQAHTAFRPPVKQWFRPSSWNLDLRSGIPRACGVVLVAGWSAVVGIRLALLLCGLHALRKLKQCSVPARDDLNQLFHNVQARLGVTRKVELKESPAFRSAVVLGFIHPVILFPIEASQALDGESVERVLGHELAHVRRLDDWANLLQQIVQTTLFFHPAVWWVSKRLTLEREIACDDFVLQQGGCPQAYALLLVDLAGRRKRCQPMLAPGVSTGKFQLQQRIDMILNTDRNTSPRLAKAKLGSLTAVTILAGLLVLYAGPRLVLAQSLAPATPADSPAGASNHAPGTSLSVGQPPAHAQPLPEPGVHFEFADAPAPSASADIETGPKFKPGEGPSEDAPSAAAPRAPRTPRPAVAPRPPRLPEPAERGSNIEERLDRLEQMVKSLVDQQKRGRVMTELSLNQAPDGGQIRIEAKREAARAAELDKSAAKQAEKAAKLEEKWREGGPLQEGLQKQLQGLHQQREMLQREMEKLERQIERIERDRERLDDQKRRHSEDEEEGSKDVAPKRK